VTKILVLDRSEVLAEQTRGVISELDGDAEVVSCTRIGSVAHVQEHDGPFSVVLAGPSLGTRAGLKRLAALHRDMPTAAFVIGLEQRPDASLREIVQVGAVDLIEVPCDDQVLRGALRRALDFVEARRRPQVVIAAPDGQVQRQARVFTVGSATGGCGKTFYATNMALFLAEHTGERVALVDLDLQFGEITTALRLQPAYTIVDAVSREGEDDLESADELAEHIEDYLVTYDGKLWTLPAPREPAQADFITPVDVTRVLEAMRTRFDYIVVDTPTALGEQVLAALDLSEHLFVMATLDLPSVRNLGMFLQTLQRLQMPVDNISLVLNKVENDIGIDPGQITKLFPQGFRSTLPYAKEVSRSINLGKPVISGYPEAEVSRLLVAGLVDFLPEHLRAGFDAAQKPQHGSVLGRFFRKHAPAEGGIR